MIRRKSPSKSSDITMDAIKAMRPSKPEVTGRYYAMVNGRKIDLLKVWQFMIAFRFGYIERWDIPQSEEENKILKRLKLRFDKFGDLTEDEFGNLERLAFNGNVKCKPRRSM